MCLADVFAETSLLLLTSVSKSLIWLADIDIAACVKWIVASPMWESIWLWVYDPISVNSVWLVTPTLNPS